MSGALSAHGSTVVQRSHGSNNSVADHLVSQPECLIQRQLRPSPEKRVILDGDHSIAGPLELINGVACYPRPFPALSREWQDEDACHWAASPLREACDVLAGTRPRVPSQSRDHEDDLAGFDESQ